MKEKKKSGQAVVQQELSTVTSATGVRFWCVEQEGGSKMVPEGLDIGEDATLEDVVGKLRDIRGIQAAATLALADIFTWARRTNNIEEIGRELDQLEFDMLTVKKSLDVADVPRSLRHPKLTAEHYYVVSRCIYEEMVRWLDVAVAKKLTAFELKKSMEVGRPLTKQQIKELSGEGSGLSSYTKLLAGWDKWKDRVGGEDAILCWPDHVLSVWVNNMEPIFDLVGKAKARLKP